MTEQDRQNVLQRVRELINEGYKAVSSDPQKCVDNSRKALSLTQEANLPVDEGMALMHIGIGMFYMSDMAEALAYYHKAHGVFEREKYYYGLRCVYSNLGILHQHMANDEQAILCFEKNLALQDMYDEPSLDASINIKLGRAVQRQKQFDKAKEYFDQALTISRDSGLKFWESIALNNMSTLMANTGDTDEALRLLRQSVDIKEELQDWNGQSSNYLNIAIILLDRHEPHEALRYAEDALALCGDSKVTLHLSNIHQTLAKAWKELGDEQKELEHLTTGLHIAREFGGAGTEADITMNLIDYHRRNGEHELALEYADRYIVLLNAMFDESRSRIIQETSARLEVDRRERETRLLRQNNAELEAKNVEIEQQKDLLEKAEDELQTWNRELEQRVETEIQTRRRQEQALIQKSKLESLGRMAAGVAHEINQPLGLIQLGIENLFSRIESGAPAPEYLEEKWRFLSQNIERIQQIIDHIRIFSRDQTEQVSQTFVVKDAIENALKMIEVQYRNHNIQIERAYKTPESLALGNPHRFEQVMLNLLVNARDALEARYDQYDDRQRIRISLSEQDGEIIMEVEDNGTGVPADVLPHVFDPFFTTKDEQQGTGLGLSLSYGIIRDMGGDVCCQSEPDSFTRFVIHLPCADPE